MKREIRAAGEASARLSGRPPYKRWRAHVSASCDTKSGILQDVPLREPGPGMEMTRASRKPPTLHGRPSLERWSPSFLLLQIAGGRRRANRKLLEETRDIAESKEARPRTIKALVIHSPAVAVLMKPVS